MCLLELTFSRYLYGSSAPLVLAGGHARRITRSIAPHSPGSNRVGKFHQKTTTCRNSSTLFYDCSVGLTTDGSSFCRGEVGFPIRKRCSAPASAGRKNRAPRPPFNRDLRARSRRYGRPHQGFGDTDPRAG